MANFEGFCQVISSSINLLFLKSELKNFRFQYYSMSLPGCTFWGILELCVPAAAASQLEATGSNGNDHKPPQSFSSTSRAKPTWNVAAAENYRAKRVVVVYFNSDQVQTLQSLLGQAYSSNNTNTLGLSPNQYTYISKSLILSMLVLSMPYWHRNTTLYIHQ